MATIPVAPVLPDINSSANIAFSRWNGMIEEGQKQYADYFANLVRTGQIGSSMPLDESIAQGTVSYGGEKVKIGELFDIIDADDIAIPSALLSKKVIALCVLYEFSFEYENSSTTGTAGTVIPVEINYECMWNANRYICLVDFSDFDSTCNELSGYYESSTKTTKTFTRLAKRVIGQGASDRLTVYANGINVPEYLDPTTVSSQVSILVPFAIFVNTGTSFETYDVVDSVVPHDIDSSLTSTDSWGLPYIRDQLVTGSTGFSKAKNNFDVDINGNIKTKSIGSLGDETDPVIEPANYFLKVTTPVEFSDPLVNTNFVIEDCYNVKIVNQGIVEKSFLGTKNTSQYSLPPWLFFVNIDLYNLGITESSYYLLSVKKEHASYLGNMKLYGLETFVYPGGASGFSQTSYVSGIYEELIDSSNRYCPFKFNPSRGDLSSPGTAILFFPVYIRR